MQYMKYKYLFAVLFMFRRLTSFYGGLDFAVFAKFR